MPSIEFTYKTVSTGDTSLRIPAYVHYAPPSHDPLHNASLLARPIVLIFHGGGFATGSTSMIPKSQVEALMRLGFVVVLPEYRLCPQVSLEEGPMEDAKDCLRWARDTLPGFFASEGILVNKERVGAIGHSAGGALALSLVCSSGVSRVFTTRSATDKTIGRIQGNLPDPPSAILDFYGTKYFSDPCWLRPVPPFSSLTSIPPIPESFHTSPVALTAPPVFLLNTKEPNFSDPRTTYVISGLKSGTLLTDAIKDCNIEKIEPTRGLGAGFPPTYFMHGDQDEMCPLELSERAASELGGKGGRANLRSVGGVGHGFDVGIGPGEELFDGTVMDGLSWLEEHV
ncbi:alpha/beta-hydrolase [Saccharata proteae CBS 121410]|uniref:Alpha/beta-hydrolase n=1 Tax=Saccharata proteae CBS 121410 TaxID=1314787 RepID=A0A9P4HND4_9PEZI|nr:alpha/beta-hydrolase [Saccharata proteae CBS 121410]